MILTHLAPRQQNQHFTFSANLADTMGALAGIYYYTRWCDTEGKGWAYIDLSEAAQALDRTRATIYSQVYLAQRRGYFWQVEKRSQDGLFFIKYKSEIRLCSEGHIGLGAIARSPISEISNIKFLATDATAEAIQSGSSTRRGKQLSSSKDDHRERLNLDTVFTDWISSEKSRGGGHLATRERFIYVSEDIAPIGGKQETIAESLGRHPSTIKRRLGNAYRQQRGVNTIDKKQVAVRSEMSIGEFLYRQQGLEMSCDEKEAYKVRRHFTAWIEVEEGIWEESVYKACPNIYNCEDVELCNQRNKRKKLNQALALNVSVESSTQKMESPELTTI